MGVSDAAERKSETRLYSYEHQRSFGCLLFHILAVVAEMERELITLPRGTGGQPSRLCHCVPARAIRQPLPAAQHRWKRVER